MQDFDMSGVPGEELSSIPGEERLKNFMELIQGYWYDFAATGDPNGGGRPAWKKYAESFDIINLNNNSGMMDKAQQEKYYYFYKKLQTNNFVVRLFGPAKFTPKEEA